MKTLTLKIPRMISHHCQMTVSNAVSRLAGAQVHTLKPAEAIIRLHTAEISVEGLVKAIEKAGYVVDSYSIEQEKIVI
jgi:copper chaperone